MPAARNIDKLTKEEQEALQTLYRQTENANTRTPCQMILLSTQERSVAEIASLAFFDEDTVLFWFDRYKARI